jgi:hypothetical protein
MQAMLGPHNGRERERGLDKTEDKTFLPTYCEGVVGSCHQGLRPLDHVTHTLLATSERFLPAGGTFRVILASKSHWLQPVLVLSVH